MINLASDSGSSLNRFVEAQEKSYETALQELRQGKKRSHWMWFIFPQLRGLGQSSMSQYYGISNLEEARRYLAHPLLGHRLVVCTKAILRHEGTPASLILGSIDTAKLRSSATLFATASDEPSDFNRVLSAFFGGTPCPLTLDRLNS